MAAIGRPPVAGRRTRSAIETLIVLGVVGLLVRTWLIEGLLRPLEVVSGSMAETLLGPHRQLKCGDCGREFACGAEVPPVVARATCPNCGYAENDLNTPSVVGGDRLLIDKSAFLLRKPRRWEVVAFRAADGTARMCVKRIVGLPGETVQLRGGDLYINGQIQRKSLAEQRALALLVHDARYEPHSGPLPPRAWLPEQPESRWSIIEGVYAHPKIPSAAAVDWLAYHHWTRVTGEPGTAVATPITDSNPYNQGYNERGEVVRPVRDLFLSFQLTNVAGEGEFVVRAAYDDRLLSLHLEIREGTQRLWVQDGDHQVHAPVDFSEKISATRGGKTLVETSLFDQQFLVALNGKPVVTIPLDDGKRLGPSEGNGPLFAIGTQGLGIEIEELRVLRDVYYAPLLGMKNRWAADSPVALGEDKYFVLGDNIPISEDSRTWPAGPGVSAKAIIGRALLVHLPVRKATVLGRDFQVPDPARIRYIR